LEVSVRPIPEEYDTVTPYVIVKGAADFIDFVARAFGAEERFRVPNEDGTLGHAEVQIGTSVVMAFDAKDDWCETPSFFTLWTEDCDKVHDAAVEAGASVVTDLSTNAWGIRGSRVRDPVGNVWWIQSQVEDVTEAETARRVTEERYVEDMQRSAETLDREVRRLCAGW
jgi:PhnB protein